MHKTTPPCVAPFLIPRGRKGRRRNGEKGNDRAQYRGNAKRRALLVARTVSQFSMLSIAWSMSRLRFEREQSVPANEIPHLLVECSEMLSVYPTHISFLQS
jgi:hypothetical protein